MNQDDINDLIWKSMADWQKNVAIDGGNLSAAKRRIKELETELEQLQNTSSNSDYTKCTNEVFKYVTDNICDEGITKKVIKNILKKHFA